MASLLGVVEITQWHSARHGEPANLIRSRSQSTRHRFVNHRAPRSRLEVTRRGFLLLGTDIASLHARLAGPNRVTNRYSVEVIFEFLFQF